MEKKVSNPVPELLIREYRARGYEAEQSWLFLKYPEKYQSYDSRWLLVRRYCANGDTWYGIRANFPDSHEKGIALIPKEMELARAGLSLIKKNWKKYLASTD